MKLTVRRSTCWLCNQSYNDSWLVTDASGHLVYCTEDWHDAILYATERARVTEQPGTGVQVRNEVTK